MPGTSALEDCPPVAAVTWRRGLRNADREADTAPMPLHEHPAVLSLCSDILAETHHTILRAIRDLDIPREPRPRLLDVGCWDGTSTQRYGAAIGAETHGIEIFPQAAKEAEARGVQVEIGRAHV